MNASLLRMLLVNVAGPTSFQQLLIVNGITLKKIEIYKKPFEENCISRTSHATATRKIQVTYTDLFCEKKKVKKNLL